LFYPLGVQLKGEGRTFPVSLSVIEYISAQTAIVPLTYIAYPD